MPLYTITKKKKSTASFTVILTSSCSWYLKDVALRYNINLLCHPNLLY
jgi:hypothetical protein